MYENYVQMPRVLKYMLNMLFNDDIMENMNGKLDPMEEMEKKVEQHWQDGCNH
jgi:hypothetical protein